jgi:hypothetical protein
VPRPVPPRSTPLGKARLRPQDLVRRPRRDGTSPRFPVKPLPLHSRPSHGHP